MKCQPSNKLEPRSGVTWPSADPDRSDGDADDVAAAFGTHAQSADANSNDVGLLSRIRGGWEAVSADNAVSDCRSNGNADAAWEPQWIDYRTGHH